MDHRFAAVDFPQALSEVVGKLLGFEPQLFLADFGIFAGDRRQHGLGWLLNLEQHRLYESGIVD